MTITHVFFDIGGVLGTNGWDTEQRAEAAREFALDETEFNERHHEAAAAWESGLMTLDEYLDCAVFHRERAFSRDAFRAFMFAQSHPFPETIQFARSLAASGRYRLMTLNNEAAELNDYRIRTFGLGDVFVAFFSSCWIGAVKPSLVIYRRALAMAQVPADRAVFVDDRDRNLGPAGHLGMHTILFTDTPRLEAELAELGVRA